MKLLGNADVETPSAETRKKVAILGLSFKSMTSDIRESPSVFIINDLLSEGHIEVCVYDPLFKPSGGKHRRIPAEISKNKNFQVAESVYDAISQSDIVVIMTNWNEFLSINLKKVRELMNKPPNSKPIILDYRNMFNPKSMNPFNYISQGQRQ
jgi:UDPglucose 6-dehydrogenase